MATENPAFLVVGHLQRPHGTGGEVFVSLLTDRPEAYFGPGGSFRLSDASGSRPEIGLPPVEVEASRPHRSGLLVAFQGIEDRNQAQILSGRYLLVPFDQVPPPEEGELFYHDLVGRRVVTVGGEELGTVREVYELSPHDLLEVAGPGGSLLIPFNRDVVVEADPRSGRLVVDPPEGLLDL